MELRLTDTAKEDIKSFYQIIAEIEKNKTIYFPRDDSPIFLHIDASDFGIGA